LDHVASQASSTLVSESCRKTDLNQPQLKTNFNTALLTLITRKGKTLNNKNDGRSSTTDLNIHKWRTPQKQDSPHL
jgi:hypothetical protein